MGWEEVEKTQRDMSIHGHVKTAIWNYGPVRKKWYCFSWTELDGPDRDYWTWWVRLERKAGPSLEGSRLGHQSGVSKSLLK